MKLFDQYPSLQNDLISIHKMGPADAEAIKKLSEDPRVRKTVPSFLYEYKYEDKSLVIEREEEECFRTKENILLGIYLRSEPEKMVGIAEIYGYEEDKLKASLGDRILPDYWGKGISTAVVSLLTDYLIDEIGLNEVTAHILRGNNASSACGRRNGYVLEASGIYEDWGKDEPCLIDKYVYKKEFRLN